LDTAARSRRCVGLGHRMVPCVRRWSRWRRARRGANPALSSVAQRMIKKTCRFCGAELQHVFCDLGASPPSNSYLREDQLDASEAFFPLLALVCDHCFLVQLPQFQDPSEIFSDYAYFSSYSESWLRHAKDYADYMMSRFKYD